jgi:16S rRNA U1498 N3-methylase RsmE
MLVRHRLFRLADAELTHAIAHADRVELFDGRGRAAPATIVAIERDRMLCEALASEQVPAPSPALHLVLGLPKGGKAEKIVRMLSERGGAGIHLGVCECADTPLKQVFDPRMDRPC